MEKVQSQLYILINKNIKDINDFIGDNLYVTLFYLLMFVFIYIL
jgi:hypothetical protein